MYLCIVFFRKLLYLRICIRPILIHVSVQHSSSVPPWFSPLAGLRGDEPAVSARVTN